MLGYFGKTVRLQYIQLLRLHVQFAVIRAIGASAQKEIQVTKLSKKIGNQGSENIIHLSSHRSKGKSPVNNRRRKALRRKTSKKSTLERVLKFVGAAKFENAQRVYKSIFGVASPVNQLLSSYLATNASLLPQVATALREHLDANPGEVGVQTTRVGNTPGSNAVISLADVKKVLKPYLVSGLDVIARLDLRPVVDGFDAHSFGYAIEVDALIFGPEAQSKLQLAARKSRRVDPFVRTDTRWCSSDDFETIDLALASVLKPSFLEPPRVHLFSDLESPANWPTKSQRDLQRYVKAMALAQLPLKKSLLLVGAGRHILLSPIGRAEHSLRVRCKRDQLEIHRDEVPHALFSELRRLGLSDVSVPVVKLS